MPLRHVFIRPLSSNQKSHPSRRDKGQGHPCKSIRSREAQQSRVIEQTRGDESCVSAADLTSLSGVPTGSAIWQSGGHAALLKATCAVSFIP